ncbi:MAG: hypothetical protein V3W44_04285 [Dehalococcoidales bacterium]
MKRTLFTLLLIAVFALPVFGQGATSWNIYSRPDESWLSGALRGGDLMWEWAKAIDTLVAAGGASGTGKNWYVDSGLTTAGDGSNWANALATLDAAINAVGTDSGANRGDWIHVAEAHAESGSVANLWDADVAGITIKHYGNGSNQGTYTFADTDTTVSIGAANVTIIGGRLLAGISEVVIGMDVTADADYLTVVAMEFPEPGTAGFEFNIAVQLVSGADDVSFVGCTAYSADETGADSWLNGGASIVNRLTLVGNVIHGEFAVANIFSDQADLECYIAGNTVTNMTTGILGIQFSGNATGTCTGNLVITDAIGTSYDTGLMDGGGGLWGDYDSSDTTPVPWTTNETGVNRWGASELAQIEAEATDALEAESLDHLVAASVADEVVDASIIADITTTGSDWSDFVAGTHSLQAIAESITALEGVNFQMTATGAGSTTSFVSTDGGDGFGDDYFNTGWAMIIVFDAGGAGAAPEGDIRDIVDYVSTTGTFTTAPVFGAATATSDKAIVVRHEDILPNDATGLGGSGRILYVDASQPGTPDVGDIGDIWDLGYTTIAAAIAGATASNGDVIYVAAGHTETIADAQLTWNVAGVKIIGRGVGSTMPIINFNHANASIDVTAADIYVEGIRFRTTIDAVLVGLDLAAGSDGFHAKKCIFDYDAATDEFLEAVEFGAAGADDVTFEECLFIAHSTGAATEAIISETGASDNTRIIGNTFKGDWAVAAIWSDQVHTNATIKDNVVYNYTTGQHAIELTGAWTGVLADNTMHGDTIGAILDPGAMFPNGNIGAISADEAGITLPLSADTTGVTTAADGSNLERLEWLQLRSDEVLASLGRDKVAANVFYVDSVAGNGGDGTSWATSEDTLKAAVDDATDNTDAVIFVASNHAETFTASVAMDSPGLTVIGLGDGGERAVLSFNNTAAALTHTVADIRYENIVFLCVTADSTVGVSLDGSSDGAKFTNCEWLTTGAFEFLSGATLAAGCDDVEFYGCKFNNQTAGVGDATAAITNIAGVTDGMVIDDCEFYGLWSTAGVISDDADTDVMVRDNVVNNTEPGAFGIEFTAAALGSCVDNRIYTDSYGIGLDPGSLAPLGNLHSYDVDGGTIDTPLIAGKTYTLSANQASVTATTDPLFAVSGPVLITGFFGVVPNGVTMGNSTMLIQSVDTEGPTTFPYTTAVDLNTDAAGTTYTFTVAVPSVLTPLLGAQNLAGQASGSLNWYCPAGTVDQLGSGAVAGVIDWYMTFIPLASNVVVTDAS